MCSWSVATDRVNRVDDAWVEETDWNRITAFGGLAERCAERAQKGALIAAQYRRDITKAVKREFYELG